MRIYILLLSLFFGYNNSYGFKENDTLYYPDSKIQYLFFNNEKELVIEYNKKNEPYKFTILLDSSKTDSSFYWDAHDFKEFQLYPNNKIAFFCGSEYNDSLTRCKTEFRILDLNTGKIKLYVFPFDIFSFYKQGIIYGEIDSVKSENYNPIIQKLYYRNIDNNEIQEFLDLNKEFGNERSIYGVFYNKYRSNEIIIGSAIKNPYEFFPDFEKSYLYDFETNAINEMSHYFDSIQFYPTNTDKIESLDGNYSLSDRFHSIDSTGINKDILFTSWNFVGLNIQNNIVINYIFESHTDTYDKRRKKFERVFVPYQLSYLLERAFYKIMYDESIEQDINIFNSLQLDMLEKMIYAKHNQFFENKYYQAFFNMYSFYNHFSKFETRLLDVSGLLTEMDKSNLNTIKKAKQK